MPSRTMPFLLSCAVVIVAIGSVVFGLDFMSAPMSPMPEVNVAAFAAPARAIADGPNAALSRAYPATSGAPPPANSDTAREAAAAPAAETANPACNVDACTSAYRSFRAADCSYQPSGGPRRLCKK